MLFQQERDLVNKSIAAYDSLCPGQRPTCPPGEHWQVNLLLNWSQLELALWPAGVSSVSA